MSKNTSLFNNLNNESFHLASQELDEYTFDKCVIMLSENKCIDALTKKQNFKFIYMLFSYLNERMSKDNHGHTLTEARKKFNYNLFRKYKLTVFNEIFKNKKNLDLTIFNSMINMSIRWIDKDDQNFQTIFNSFAKKCAETNDIKLFKNIINHAEFNDKKINLDRFVLSAICHADSIKFLDNLWKLQSKSIEKNFKELQKAESFWWDFSDKTTVWINWDKVIWLEKHNIGHSNANFYQLIYPLSFHNYEIFENYISKLKNPQQLLTHIESKIIECEKNSGPFNPFNVTQTFVNRCMNGDGVSGLKNISNHVFQYKMKTLKNKLEQCTSSHGIERAKNKL